MHKAFVQVQSTSAVFDILSELKRVSEYVVLEDVVESIDVVLAETGDNKPASTISLGHHRWSSSGKIRALWRFRRAQASYCGGSNQQQRVWLTSLFE
jgi:hypothetical protein